MARFPIVIQIANVLAYVFLLGANVYTVAGPDDSPYDDKHKTFITPAPFVFGIWGLIHFLFFGFVIYQFFSAARETVVDGIHWHFLTISLWNTLWLYLWASDHLILSWLVILVTGSQVSYVYYLVRNKYPAQGINDVLWIHAPFSLYHAWILVIIVVNTFAAFTPEAEGDEKPSLVVKILVALGILFLQSTAVGYIELGKGDLAGSLVIAWALFGISVEQTSSAFIHWFALVFSILTAIYSLKPFVKKYFFASHEETAPLLG